MCSAGDIKYCGGKLMAWLFDRHQFLIVRLRAGGSEAAV